MRDVAARVGVSLGAAYYYFAGKDAIVGAYYDHVHDVHAAGAGRAFAVDSDVRERLRVALHSKVDVTRGDRKLLRGAFPVRWRSRPRAVLVGPATVHRRRESIASFARPSPASLPADLREAGPSLLWGLHMGVLLFFVYDDRPISDERDGSSTRQSTSPSIYEIVTSR